jgi:transcriptional regulator with XRE-family HTH domain
VKESLGIVARLKRAVKAKGLTYRELAAALGMSEAGVKRAFAKGSFTLARLDEICGVLGITLVDLVRTTERVDESAMHLSETQEAALASDDKLYCYFSLLLAGMKPAAIVAKFQFTTPESEKALATLERLGLLTSGLGGRVTLHKAEDFVWATDGPLVRRHWPAVAQEFVAGEFKRHPHAHLSFSAGRLSASSLDVLRKKVEALVADFDQMVAMDATTDGGERRVSVWFLNAFRPWAYSVVMRYRRAPR